MIPAAVLLCLIIILFCAGCAGSRSPVEIYQGIDHDQSAVVDVEGMPVRMHFARETLEGTTQSPPTLFVAVNDSIPAGETLRLDANNALPAHLSGGGGRGSVPYLLDGDTVEDLIQLRGQVAVKLTTVSGELEGHLSEKDWPVMREFLEELPPSMLLPTPRIVDDGSGGGSNGAGIFGGMLIALGGVLGVLATSDAIGDAQDFGIKSGNLEAQRIGWMSVAAGGLVVAVSAGMD